MSSNLHQTFFLDIECLHLNPNVARRRSTRCRPCGRRRPSSLAPGCLAGQGGCPRPPLPGGEEKQSSCKASTDDTGGRCGQDEPREPAPHLAAVPLGQARTTTSIVPPNSSPADPGEKKARGPSGPGLCGKNAALSLQLWVPESWNQQLRSWQPPRRLGQPPPWSCGPRHSVLCDSSSAGWAEDLCRQRCFRCPRAPCKLTTEPLSSPLRLHRAQLTRAWAPP